MAGPADFEVATERSAGALVVAPRGEIDIATVGLVKSAFEAEHQAGEELVLDLRGVGFMDTSGLRLVLEFHDRAGREGFGLRIVSGPAAVQRVFEVSGLTSRLPFVDDPSLTPE